VKFKSFSGTGSPFQTEPKYIHVGKALIEESGYNFVKINNTDGKPFKINPRELASDLITADNIFHIE
jgi:hypothetical protein